MAADHRSTPRWQEARARWVADPASGTLWQPTAAIIWANAFMAPQDDTADLLTKAWETPRLMCLALAALPALVKVVNSAAAVASTGGAGLAGSALQAAPTRMAAVGATAAATKAATSAVGSPAPAGTAPGRPRTDA